MLGESRRLSACPAASKGTLPDDRSYFIMKECERNVTDALFPLFFRDARKALTSTRVFAFGWPSGNGRCTRSKTQDGPRVNRTGPFASDTCALMHAIWKARSLS